MKNVVGILKDLISLPSINPRLGKDLPADLIGESRVARYVEDFVRGIGLDVIVQEIGQPGRYNVGGALLRGKDRKTIVLQSHMDTVGIQSAPELLTPMERDGLIHGRGACDDKGGLAAMLAALAIAAKSPELVRNNVIVMAVAGEEIAFEGSLALVEQAPTAGADFGLVGEPTSCRIVTGCKGVARWKIETTGVSCHSAHPEQGINAIYRMGKILALVEDYQRELSRIVDDRLGAETVSVGTIHGGTAANVVPDRCEIEIDRRLTRHTSPEGARQAVGRYLRERGIDFELGMSDLTDAQPAAVVDDSHPGVRLLADASRRLGLDPDSRVAAYTSDANRMNAAGIPTILWGPGSVDAAHTQEESVPIAELETAVEFYRCVIQADRLESYRGCE